MKVYTLSGKSGTGKSFQAMNLCNELNIESIIDDGLFIYHSRVEAGMSAKRQDTRVGAIKTALFTLEEHRDSVVSKIALRNPNCGANAMAGAEAVLKATQGNSVAGNVVFRQESNPEI